MSSEDVVVIGNPDDDIPAVGFSGEEFHDVDVEDLLDYARGELTRADLAERYPHFPEVADG